MIMQELILRKLHAKAERIRMEGLTPSSILVRSGSLNCYLFCSLRNHLVIYHLADEADLKSDLEVFFSSLSKKFFEDGILNLPKR